MGLYERYLAFRIRRRVGDPPEHVALVITERDLLEQGAYETLVDFFEWAFEYARQVTVYVSVLDTAAVPTLRRQLEELETPRDVAVRGPDDRDRADAPIRIGIGLGGKHEFTSAVRTLAEGVAAGELEPGEIDDEDVERHLVFPSEPDLVIKTGAERLSDFMIWQSVYSELYFTDVNWRDFRERDFLRAVLEFCTRSRRFGR
ncbi:undecaprenyl diphosphate synthase family protein [Natrialbaceae archaeon AArc-T1-2]|uniref:undecaprenyl diphosphate synthase family protein n=1 Tax=Natrialbaceae archaeon AArc-T1-2 TaxID=3053904 RepID=UPI00255A825D|nr:undecaprenyl diphosphate synthase family protein [Natrialbaceae archaeon AArc-T1-2]WIV67964.1 undecaprenyl diphosphate synthase family protein [Natrialbaceae archaeon AArc-T1-2]